MTEAPTSPAALSPGSEPGGPLIDWLRVAELRDEIGGEDFDEVVALFLTEVQATLDRLPAHAESLQDLSEQLHFLKGSTLNLGFARLSTLCEAGELAITAGLGAPLDPELLRRCYARSREEFLAQLPELRAA
ncbi:Hpt domain-containing protein [Yangia mangrovi]|uniref:Histidine kinase n=1 Tax=Alloyangia mangrovi TaxID=1779329 RepID=A0A2A3JX00_9RHOB|nr:Hpt domain-containing protein [Alloyangia mangrovi]MCT4369730.1 Hpt domain-containing protein [Alloyangia mangrovi]